MNNYENINKVYIRGINSVVEQTAQIKDKEK